MVKGDAEKARVAKTIRFSQKYKVGDIAFCPIYGRCKILKMNAKTVGVMQVDENGKQTPISRSIRPNGNPPLIVEKYLFTV